VKPFLLLLSLGLLIFSGAPSALAGDDDPEPREGTVDFTVKREKLDNTPKTLRFLHANRNFFRSELDRLQTRRLLRKASARGLTDREKFLITQNDQVRSDADSLRAAVETAQRSDYLQSAKDLLEFEHHLDELEGLLRQQNSRLLALEADFVDRQATALALYVTGLDDDSATAILVNDPAGDQWQIELDAAQRRALRNGATTQLFHEYVEPRQTQYHLALRLASGEERALGELSIVPTRDRLTFIEVDLSADGVGASLPHRKWER
jgi:hypothetical protein